jgi:hypothetical protein
MPLRQARHELLWLLGLGGVMFGLVAPTARRVALVGGAWIAAAVVAIAINGRDLPQYFVQATPALALAGGTGLAAAWQSRTRLLRAAVVVLLVVGFWRVGTDRQILGVARLAGLPGLVDNVRFDMEHWRGQIDRRTYLERFGGQRAHDKFAALDVDDLSAIVAGNSAPDDRVMVFGFSPGALVKAHRVSASRFFWSLPVILEFAADQPGYGSRGLLEDLIESEPSLVVLQKGDWTQDSLTFFMETPHLASWLLAHYLPLTENHRYAVWRRTAAAIPSR